MIVLLLVLLAILATIAVAEGWVIVGLMFAAGAEDAAEAAELEDATPGPAEPVPAWLVGSEAGTRAVGVRIEACLGCGQTLPADHQCTGRVAI